MKKDCTYSVYRHISPSGKVYVGITKNKPEWRWNHGKGYNRHQTLFWNAILKYGWDNIIHEVLLTGLSKEEACTVEIDLIAKYKKLGLSYNITAGGDGGTGNKSHTGQRWSDEAKRRMSESHKGLKYPNRKPRPIEKRRYGKDNKNSKVVYQYNREGSFVKKWECISDIQRELGIKTTNICCVCRGKSFTVGGFRWSYDYPYVFSDKEFIARKEKSIKISQKAKDRCKREGYVFINPMLGRKGKLAPMYGKHGSLSPLKRKVYQYTTDGQLIKEWDCIKEAANQVGCHSTSISAVCRGKIKTTGGFCWSY